MNARQVFAVAAALLFAAGAVPLEGAPQQPGAPEPDTAESNRVVCLHGEPPPTCDTFWIVELQVSRGWLLEDPPRVDGVFGYDEGFTWYEWTVGHMANLGPRWALGGTVSIGNGNHDIFTGVRARVRRWIQPHLSVELEAGLAESTGGGAWYPALTAPSAGVRFNIQDHGSAFLRYDAFGTPEGSRPVGPNDSAVPWGRKAMVRAGIGLGGKPALVGTGVVAGGFIVFLAILSTALSGT